MHNQRAHIKGGGRTIPEGYLFELTGGVLCLDFANTVDNRPAQPRELLKSYDDLVAWAEQAGVLQPELAVKLRAEATRRPDAAAAALDGARALREAAHAVLTAAVRGEEAPADSLGMLEAAVAPSLARRRLVQTAGGFAWVWTYDDAALDGLLAPVVESAATLLTSPELARVRECEADTCGWLFLDRSRNRSRRWCDMSVCGNRAKVRRHYQRTKRAT